MNRHGMIRAGLLLACLALAACEPEPKLFDRDSFPDRLSEWGLLTVAGGGLKLHSESTAYDLNAPLFTDYAHKLRTVWTPADATGSIAADGELLLPVGAVITKTFYYPADGQGMIHVDADPVQFTDDGLNLDQVYLMETRLLVHLEDGWHGLPYVWNEDQTDATLEITGGVYPVNVTGIGEFNYVVPDFNQCQGCHETDLTAGKMGPIGLKARHLDKAYPWLTINWVTSRSVIAWMDWQMRITGLMPGWAIRKPRSIIVSGAISISTVATVTVRWVLLIPRACFSTSRRRTRSSWVSASRRWPQDRGPAAFSSGLTPVTGRNRY